MVQKDETITHKRNGFLKWSSNTTKVNNRSVKISTNFKIKKVNLLSTLEVKEDTKNAMKKKKKKPLFRAKLKKVTILPQKNIAYS